MPTSPYAAILPRSPHRVPCRAPRWYEANGRQLNFRARRDPYAVLVSEVMAQQTQISRVEPAWEAFLDRFPTVEALAAAPTADVLRGLGRAWATTAVRSTCSALRG